MLLMHHKKGLLKQSTAKQQTPHTDSIVDGNVGGWKGTPVRTDSNLACSVSEAWGDKSLQSIPNSCIKSDPTRPCFPDGTLAVESD